MSGPDGPFDRRAIGTLAHLRREEIVPVAVAVLYNFLLFTAYYILRPLRDSMGVTGGIAALGGLFWATFVGTLVATPLFGWLCSRYPRGVFLPWTYGFFVLNLLGFWSWFMLSHDDTAMARAFFVWTSVFNLFVVSVFWSFMADVFEPERATRSFGIIAAGASAGAIGGSAITTFLAEHVGDVNLLLVSAMLLASGIPCIAWLQRRARDLGRGTAADEQPIGGNPFEGIALVARSPYLAGVGVFVVLLTAVSTLLYMQQAHLLAVQLPDGGERTAFLGRIDLIVNLLAVSTQLLAVGRLVERFGLAVMLAAVPLLVAAGFASLALAPSLMMLAMIIVIRRAGEYAVTRPCREMLFTGVGRAARYKAKNFIDTVVYRGGDALSASLHDALVRTFALGLSGIAWFGAVVALLWALAGFALGRNRARGVSGPTA